MMPLLGNVAWETKTFLRTRNTYHGDVHLREEIFDLRTLVDRTAGSVKKRG